MDTPPPLEKKGLGALAWTGIGCGSIVLLIVIGIVVASVIFGPKVKEFAKNMEKDPTRTMATAMVTMSAGQLSMVAEDEPNKRYTVKDKTGKLTTIYWNEKKQAPEVVPGDFSAIPAETSPTEPSTPPATPPSAESGTIDPAVSEGVPRLEKK